MLLRLRFAVWAVGGLLIITNAAALHAQLSDNMRRRQQQRPAGEKLKIKGTIDGVRPGAISVTSATNEKWMLNVPGNANVRVIGTADLDFLKPGDCIRFTGTVDKRSSRLEGELSRFTIFTPSPQLMLGAFPDSSGGLGAGPAKGGDKAAAGAESRNYTLAGQVTSIKGNKLVLSVPNFSKKFSVDVAQTPEIDFNISDYGVAKQGDSIEISQGVKLAPGVGAILEAKIRVVEPFKAPQQKSKKPAAPAGKSPRTAKKPGGGQPAAEPAPN